MSNDSTATTPPSGNSHLSRFWLVLLMATGAVLICLPLRPAASIPDLPLSEDAYYAFSVSRNIIDGNGITIDGSNQTNGFQPLFTLLTAPIFALEDGLSLRLILLVQAGLFTLSALTLSRISLDASIPGRALERRSGIVLLTLFYLSAASLFRAHMNGLETGLLLLLYTIFWREYQLRGLPAGRAGMRLGAIGGALVLTHIDSIFVLGCFALVHLWAKRRDLKQGIYPITQLAAVSAAISAPWWIYNQVAFGSLVPTSGTAQQEWGLDISRADDTVEALVQAVNPWVYLGDRFASFWPIALVGAVLAAGAMWLIARQTDRSSSIGPTTPESLAREQRATEFCIALTLGGLALAAWYFASSWATHFYPRYLALLMLPSLHLWSRLILGFAPRHLRLTTAAVTALTLAGSAFMLTYFVPSWNSGSSMWRDQVPLVEELVPPADPVAAGQSGTLGFFRSKVINLDGKVNASALERQDDIPAYLEEEGIEWLCDWPNYIDRYLGPNPSDGGWQLAGERGLFVCMHREGTPDDD